MPQRLVDPHLDARIRPKTDLVPDCQPLLSEQIMPTKYAIDTQVFNWICDFDFDLSALQPAQFFISVVQEAELRAIKDEARRERLLALLAIWEVEIQPAESFVFRGKPEDSSPGLAGLSFGNWKWSDGVTYLRILEVLNAARPKSNNDADALIGEHALKNNLSLLTGDRNLAAAMKALGAQVRFVEHPSKGMTRRGQCAATTKP